MIHTKWRSRAYTTYLSARVRGGVGRGISKEHDDILTHVIFANQDRACYKRKRRTKSHHLCVKELLSNGWIMQNNKIIENAIVHCVQVGAYTNTRTHMCNPPGGKGCGCPDCQRGTSIVHPKMPALIIAVILGPYNLSITDSVIFSAITISRE